MKELYDRYLPGVGIAIMVMIGLVTMYGFKPTYDLLPALCSPDDHGACFRTWVSALSGWAAALVALLTIRILLEQLKSQRQQSDFLLGDALPTIAASDLQTDEFIAIIVRITNWNRRSITINAIENRSPAPGFRFEFLKAERPGHVQLFHQNDLNDGIFTPEILVPGYEDPSSAPPVLILHLRPLLNQPKMDFGRRQVDLCIIATILGDTHKRIELDASAYAFSL